MTYTSALKITKRFTLNGEKLNPEDLFSTDWETSDKTSSFAHFNSKVATKSHFTIKSLTLGISINLEYARRNYKYTISRLGSDFEPGGDYTLTSIGFISLAEYEEAFKKKEQAELFRLVPNSGEFLLRAIDDNNGESIDDTNTVYFEQSFRYRFNNSGKVSLIHNKHRHLLFLDSFKMQNYSKKRDVFVKKTFKTSEDKKIYLNASNNKRLKTTSLTELPFSNFSEIKLEQRDISVQKLIKFGTKYYLNAEVLDYRLANYFCEIDLDELSKLLKELLHCAGCSPHCDLQEELLSPIFCDKTLFDSLFPNGAISYSSHKNAINKCLHISIFDKDKVYMVLL